MKNFHEQSIADIFQRAKQIKDAGTETVGYNTATRVTNCKPVGLASIIRLWANVTFIATTPELADRFYAEIDTENESPEVPATEISPAETVPAPVIIKKLKRK